tara:strand:+ start:639 stop:1160 length:522 start_codon:yes stop_codon:yes gene_type:complete
MTTVVDVIETVTLTGDVASVTFSGIPATFEHLQVRCATRAAGAAAGMAFFIEFNGSAGTAYSTHGMAGATSAIYGLRLTGEAKISVFNGTHGTSVDASELAPLILDVMDYKNTNKNTTVQLLYGSAVTLTANERVTFGSGLWDSTAAITSIKFTPSSGDLVTGSTFTLYGIKG